MSAELLLRKFGQVAAAPGAVAHLRRFILDLAVRGRLTERCPTDEPAHHLLSQIESRLAEVCNVSRQRKSLTFKPIEPDQEPFSVPDTWLWTRVRQITCDRGQTVPESDFTYIDVTAIDKELGRIKDPSVMSAADAPSRARKIVAQGDVIYSCVRPYLLNIAVVDADIDPPPIASTAFAVLNGTGLVVPHYLWTVLRSPYFVSCVEEKMRGQAYPAINDSDFSLLPVPLPPLAEQRRIVARVDEMMALCDQMEATQGRQELLRDALGKASLQRLTATEEDSGIRSGNTLSCLERFDRF